MCGIIGYCGDRQAVPVLIAGLKALEYRGYDSAGVAVVTNEGITIKKKKGRVKALEETIALSPLMGDTGIGHTRWATHGEPSDGNAHPHSSENGRISLVHNGIIENYMELREGLIARGVTFTSETDTEVVVHLLAANYAGDLKAAMFSTMKQLKGSFAIAAICADEPGRIVCSRCESPLVIGLGENENFVASDISALLGYTREMYLVGEKNVAVVEKDSVRLFDSNGEEVHQEAYHVDWDVTAAEKGGYDHYMEKEMHEQPRALHDTIVPRIKNGSISLDCVDDEYLKTVGRIVICACGTAYHAGMVGKRFIESMARVPVDVDIASEYRYREPILSSNQLCIVVSQSGETADTIAALRTFKAGGGKVLSITNVLGSTVARESDMVLYTFAGPEIAVASTKAYTTQLAVLFLLAMELGRVRGTLSDESYTRLIQGLEGVPDVAQKALDLAHYAKEAAHRHYHEQHVFFIGRGYDQPATMESSLKLKEISYIHSEALPAGELKHGTIALIEQGTLVVAMSTQSALCEKLASNIKEVKARGAQVMLIARDSDRLVRKEADEYLPLPPVDDELAPLVSVIPAQLFAYYCAVKKGYDPDKPRNLAKSVTVE